MKQLKSFEIMSIQFIRTGRSVVLKLWFVHELCGGEQTVNVTVCIAQTSFISSKELPSYIHILKKSVIFSNI